MTEQTPQPPQDEQAPSTKPEPPSQEDLADDAPAAIDPSKLTYHEYLKLTNPGKSDEEIAKMVRKENRYTWIGRFQILAFIVFLILILVFIFVK